MVEKLPENLHLSYDYLDVNDKVISRSFKNLILSLTDMWRILIGKVNPNLHNHPSSADATLSGTAKVFEILDDAGTTYYFKGYPTKS